MIRHDLRCIWCDALHIDMFIEQKEIRDGFVQGIRLKCDRCGSSAFYITWESGEAPKGYVHQETVGDLWAKKDFDPHSEKAKKASAEAIKKTQKDTLKRKK